MFGCKMKRIYVMSERRLMSWRVADSDEIMVMSGDQEQVTLRLAYP